MKQTPIPVTVSTLTIIKVVAVLVALWFAYVLADIILLFVASLLLAAAIDPYVDRLQKQGIPRSISMIGIYLVMFSLISIALVLTLPPLVHQISGIAMNFPGLYHQLLDWMGQFGLSTADSAQNSGLNSVPNAISAATQGVFSIVANIFGGIFSFLTVVVMTFYLVIDEGSIRRMLAIAPAKHQIYLANLYERLQDQVGVWLRAQLVLMLLIGGLTYLFLTIINLLGYNMPYVLTLSFVAGLTEFVPYVGPIIGAIPAMFIAYNISPGLMMAVGIAYYGIQTLENNVFVPKIMERALGISPILSILVFLIGAQLAGIMGAFLAIPIATAANVIVKDVMARRRSADTA